MQCSLGYRNMVSVRASSSLRHEILQYFERMTSFLYYTCKFVGLLLGLSHFRKISIKCVDELDSIPVVSLLGLRPNGVFMVRRKHDC